jgi:hypothetical protein
MAKMNVHGVGTNKNRYERIMTIEYSYMVLELVKVKS